MQLDPGMLTRLRAFEAVGRLRSFTQAAQELYVTPAALSHHVRHLEQALGVQLVIRMHRRIDLTDEGKRLLADCSQALQTLDRAITAARHDADARPLTISVAPYFSARWLTPRLPRLWASHPEIDLHLHHAYQPADFHHDDVDAGISWGHGKWPDTNSTLVLDGSLTPVASPGYLRQLPEPIRPADLLCAKLLYEFNIEDWYKWLDAARQPGRPPIDAHQIDDSHTLRRLAADGHGIALFFVGLVQDDLRTRQLVQPFDLTVDTGDHYYLTWPRGRPMRPKLATFSHWLRDEIRKQPHA
jgi:DNA-binding transcriptional LysR family regulator